MLNNVVNGVMKMDVNSCRTLLGSSFTLSISSMRMDGGDERTSATFCFWKKNRNKLRC